MAKTVVTTEVKGFEHWHPGSNEHAGVRPRIGDESRTKANRTAEDPNDISITRCWYESSAKNNK